MHFQRSAAPPLIFDPHPIRIVTKGRKNNIPRSIEDLITHINIYFFSAQFLSLRSRIIKILYVKIIKRIQKLRAKYFGSIVQAY